MRRPLAVVAEDALKWPTTLSEANLLLPVTIKPKNDISKTILLFQFRDRFKGKIKKSKKFLPFGGSTNLGYSSLVLNLTQSLALVVPF